MDKFKQLEKLAELKASGALSEEEFAAQKEKVLDTDIPIHDDTKNRSTLGSEKKEGTSWLPVPAMVIGIISFLTLFDTEWDTDTVNGLLLLSAIGLTLGVVSLSVQRKGRGMAIVGIVLCVIAGICAIGLLVM